MELNWQPWETAPINDGPVTLMVALDTGRGVEYHVFERFKISNGYLSTIGHHNMFDEATPFAWAYFNQVNISPETN